MTKSGADDGEGDSAPISAFLIVKNEAARLPRALRALDGLAAQVVVVDGGSTDDSVAIARAHGAEVFHRDWTGYGAQKRFAEDNCAHDWRLNVDADEVVTPALADEIRAAARGRPAAYRIRILNVYPGDARPRPFAADYNVVRFYHAAAGRYRDHPLFDRVETLTPPRQLRAPIWHYPFLNWHALTEKENAYSTYQAQAAKPRARWRLLVRLAVEFPLVFFKSYFLRGHALGGWKGFAFSVNIAFARFMRVVKMLERDA